MKTVVIIGERTGKIDALIKAVRKLEEVNIVLATTGEDFMQEFSKQLEKPSQTLEIPLPKINAMKRVYFDDKKHQPPHQRRKRNGK